MLDPRSVYNDVHKYLSHLTATKDVEVEDQFFDRKEASRPGPDGTVSDNQVRGLKAQVAECISAFANTNPQGGLIVVGVSSTGELRGVNHLTDGQRNCISNFNDVLRNHSAQIKLVDCADASGVERKLLLVFVPFTRDAICETIENRTKAWQRNGAQNVFLDERQREQLRRDKGIVDFENSIACAYRPNELDRAILKELRASLQAPNGAAVSDEELLHQLGALEPAGEGWAWTKAGFLFFAANPQRLFSSAAIRLLRFDVGVRDANRGLPTFDRKFAGPLSKQIRDFRTFIGESGLFKQFQYRNPDGGFAEEPEYPAIAVDEAIVNAVAHRDYACEWLIECEAYKDAFLVKNAGRIIQRSTAVPSHFSLDDKRLVHTPRNTKLFEWLRTLKDNQGSPFVRALSEGTRRMQEEMAKLKLPPPIYDVTESETRLTLFGDQERRAALISQAAAITSTEYANLFPLEIRKHSGANVEYTIFRDSRNEFLLSLKDSLAANGWFIDSIRHGLLTAHRRGVAVSIPSNAARFVGLYAAYSFGVRDYGDRSYLLIDFSLEVKNLLSLPKVLDHVNPADLLERTVVAKSNGWQRGKLLGIADEWASVHLFDFEETRRIPCTDVIPNLPLWQIKKILHATGIRFDLDTAIKKHALASVPAAARSRAERTLRLAEEIAGSIFPFGLRGAKVFLSPQPLVLARDPRQSVGLPVRSIDEPPVEFGRHRETPNIREGITEFGSFDVDQHDIEIVPVVDQSLRNQMVELIERLKIGRYKYRGSERTFKTRLGYGSIITVASPDALVDECRRLLSEHPNWVGDKSLKRIFLIHAPEQGYALDDQSSPYFLVKRLLLESGVPCQMVDTPTLLNPDYKDLNLALNIVAKCGLTPWVLPEGIPDADFFIGLSYTQSGRGNATRLMGYANVFNQYGKWLFYAGNSQTFSYEERGNKLGVLVKQTLEQLSSQLPETPHVYFHYSAKFSRDDREAVLRAAREIRPQGLWSFVWINSHHRVRLYDSSPETDGSLSRGSYVVAGPHQIYVSTTGYNPYRKALGTPQMLEVNVWREFPPGIAASPIDPRAMAAQVLALTKLNWSSTDSLCGEPITTKYAGDIAYLTAAFLRQGQPFKLHPVLEPTPWFI